jgi:predicted ferric reductase
MKKLCMTRHSTLLLAYRRLANEQRRVALLEARVDALAAELKAMGAGAPAKQTPVGIFAGLIVLALVAIVAIKACQTDAFQGGTGPMNVQFLLAAIVALVAVTLHVYTFEVWIWPKLKDIGFPATPFGGPEITKGFYRTVWHFFTVSWVLTIGLLLFFTFGDVVPYANMIVTLLMVYWICIVISIFIVSALSLEPGQSYIKTMAKAFQWVIVLIMVGLMYWGTKV